MPHQQSHCCTLHNFNCNMFTVRWKPTYPLLLLPHQHTVCFSPRNFNCMLFTVLWQTTFTLLLLHLEHTHTPFHYTILTAYCLQSADSQIFHCCCCPTNTHTAVDYTFLTAYCLQSADSQLFHCCCCPTNTHTAGLQTQFKLLTVCCPLKANIPTAVAAPPTHWMLFTTQFNCIWFSVRWQPTYPLLLLPHQQIDCCSLLN